MLDLLVIKSAQDYLKEANRFTLRTWRTIFYASVSAHNASAFGITRPRYLFTSNCVEEFVIPNFQISSTFKRLWIFFPKVDFGGLWIRDSSLKTTHSHTKIVYWGINSRWMVLTIELNGYSTQQSVQLFIVTYS
jgi:hypothetical protein